MMENRSFDHYLGWLPNATGRQSGLTYLDKNRSLASRPILSRPIGPDADTTIPITATTAAAPKSTAELWTGG